MLGIRDLDPVTVSLPTAVSTPGRWARSAGWCFLTGWSARGQVLSQPRVEIFRRFGGTFAVTGESCLNRLGCAYAPRSSSSSTGANASMPATETGSIQTIICATLARA